jgi:hypothetical protein
MRKRAPSGLAARVAKVVEDRLYLRSGIKSLIVIGKDAPSAVLIQQLQEILAYTDDEGEEA